MSSPEHIEGFVGINALDIAEMQEALKRYDGFSEDVINHVLHGYGGEKISEAAQRRVHPSGKTWRGKARGARDVMPFRVEPDRLAVWVKTKPSHRYLYFPDDGSSTRKHAGNQMFMFRGAEQAAGLIVHKFLDEMSEYF